MSQSAATVSPARSSGCSLYHPRNKSESHLVESQPLSRRPADHRPSALRKLAGSVLVLMLLGTGGNPSDANLGVRPVSLDVLGDPGRDACRLARGRPGAGGISFGAAEQEPSPGGRSVLGCLPRVTRSP